MTESSEEYSHASESIELVLFSVLSIIWLFTMKKKKRSKKLLSLLNKVFDNFWEYNPYNDCWIFLTSFSAQKLRQIEDLKEQQRSGKTLEKNQVCYGLWDRLLNKILSK